jgi:hypothetical protein
VVWAQWLDFARRGEWLSRRLTALWAQCDARAHNTGDGLGPLDFDVATNSQGMEVKSFAVKTLSQDASHAKNGSPGSSNIASATSAFYA